MDRLSISGPPSPGGISDIMTESSSVSAPTDQSLHPPTTSGLPSHSPLLGNTQESAGSGTSFSSPGSSHSPQSSIFSPGPSLDQSLSLGPHMAAIPQDEIQWPYRYSGSMRQLPGGIVKDKADFPAMTARQPPMPPSKLLWNGVPAEIAPASNDESGWRERSFPMTEARKVRQPIAFLFLDKLD